MNCRFRFLPALLPISFLPINAIINMVEKFRSKESGGDVISLAIELLNE